MSCLGQLLTAYNSETPETFHFLTAHDTVPLKTEFKPALKVLSRKPSPQIVTRQDPVTGLSQMTIENDEDEDEDLNKNRLTAEELRLKAQRDREEKQRKYEEARARLFGTPDTGSGSSRSGQLAPPTQGDEGRHTRVRGRGRGSNRQDCRGMETRDGTKKLFDPNYTPKPGSVTIKKRDEDGNPPGLSMGREAEQVIRAPRGPGGNGRANFGFINQGKEG